MAGTPKEQVGQRLSTYPPEAQIFLKGAFGEAARLDEKIRDQVLLTLLDNFRTGRRAVSGSALSGIDDLSTHEAELVASVYSIIIGLISETGATAQEFVDAASDVLFLPEHREAALSVANSICSRRDEVDAAIEIARVSGSALPKLMRFDLATDVRLKVEEGRVTATLPLALLHIDTDRQNQELWLQLTKLDVQDMLKKLTECLKAFEAAQQFAARKP